ncbi:MAG: hypothetical protein WDA22_11265 [Bacteroidota bacterium]
MTKPLLVYSTIILFSLFSTIGCSSSRQTGMVQPAGKSVEAPSYKMFSKHKEKVYRLSISALQKLGYVVTVSDANIGLISAEKYTTSPIIEDVQPVSTIKTKPSAGEVFFTFLSILLVFGLIIMIVDAASSNSSSSTQSSNKETTEHHHSENHHVNTTIESYKYILSIQYYAFSDTATKIVPAITKVTVSNGTSTSSSAIRSSVMMNEFYRSLENELFFVP